MPENQVAVIDIGSNSVRMVVFNTSFDVPHPVFNEKVFCALGKDIVKTGKLNANAVKTALLALTGFVSLAKAKQVKRIIAVGTAALRDASNSKEFLKTVKTQIGLTVRIISGENEAFYAALGVSSLDPKAEGFVADFGGGSLEIAQLKKKNIIKGNSYPVGAYRMIEHGAKAYDIVFDKIKANTKKAERRKNLYIIGGSWRALLQSYAIYTKQGDIRLQGYKIKSSDIKAFCTSIEKMPEQKLMKTYRLEKHRAHLLPISSIILRATIDALESNFVIVSTAGIRDGVICEYLQKGR